MATQHFDLRPTRRALQKQSFPAQQDLRGTPAGRTQRCAAPRCSLSRPCLLPTLPTAPRRHGRSGSAAGRAARRCPRGISAAVEPRAGRSRPGTSRRPRPRRRRQWPPPPDPPPTPSPPWRAPAAAARLPEPFSRGRSRRPRQTGRI